MKEYIRLNINYKVSLVLMFIDDYTSMPVKGSNIVPTLAEVIKKPIKKNDGCFVFTDICGEFFNLNIKSSHYFEENIKLDMKNLDIKEPIVYLRLKPSPNYPFNNEDTIVRLMLSNSKTKKISAAKINAIITSPELSKVKIIQDKIEKGINIPNFHSIAGILTIGEELYIHDGKKEEYCRINKIVDYENKLFELENPLKYQHTRGVLLMPVVRTYTDFKGETVIYFKAVGLKKIEFKLEILHEEKNYQQQVTAEAGSTIKITI